PACRRWRGRWRRTTCTGGRRSSSSSCNDPSSREDVDAVRAVVGEDLEGGTVAGRERLGAAAAGEPQVARGDLGVEAVLRAAGRVAVGEPDEGVGRRGDRALDRHAAAGGREAPAEVLEAPAGAERLPEGVERQFLAVVADNDGGEEGRPEGTEPQTRGAHLEEDRKSTRLNS